MFKQLALVLALSPLAVQASNLPDYPFIHAGGEGFVMIVPDLGEIDFDISAADTDPAAAVAVVETRVAEVRALLAQQAGTADEGASATVRDARKEMRKPANPDPAAAPDYELRSSVHIVVRDLGKWRPIMQALLAMPNIDRLATTFGKTDRLGAEQELTAVAVKDARRRADAMAAGFGKKVGAVTAISSGQLRNLTGAVGLMPGDVYKAHAGIAAQEQDKDFLAIDVLKWSQTVDMIFRIK